ncbi:MULTISPECIES: hypothetical protein [Clostridium]|uniref:Uncharacterized protein n=1 Tax=Clostridium cadaveris TaxID=1529 RepID=A0A1I2MXL5_9CLOT|nr:hypothetical protein [Clostridium cadaveris]MDU4953242.1 hypothetical protein [Clostridium sp.]MDM8312720.1 hypothetical protein [Clostridium cadaveris]MDY4948734.1 hypothetical protein [Clostridium cadaveris]NME65405.1 hypothetical protein [Clostridium cadaveris]NWK11786.1 hypothetical protein [Clostridium cadaveris]
MGKHKRHRSPEPIMDNSAMYPPGMMGSNMNPSMMNPNMMNPNMMNGNMMNGNMNQPNMMNGNMNQPNGGPMPFNQNPSTGNPFFDMLGSADFSQLGSLLGALTSNGVNLNDINLGNNNINDTVYEDSTMQLLNALRPFMPSDKVGIIDKVIQMYSNGELND